MVLVSGSPETIKVFDWIEAYAKLLQRHLHSGFLKCITVLSSLKKLISSAPSCWAPVFLIKFLMTLSLDPWIKLHVYLLFGDDFDLSSLRTLSSCSCVTDFVSEFIDVSLNFFLT